MLDLTEEEEEEEVVPERVERRTHRNSILSWLIFKFFMIVCKTSISEESGVV